MSPKYSILYFRQMFLPQVVEEIETLLHEGKKIFWFGTRGEAESLRNRYKSFADSFFLQTFDITEVDGHKTHAPAVIMDGAEIDGQHRKLFNWLEENVPVFNAAQFRVEHCAEETNIVVKASAGTGKTTVMVDRILYLMHTVPDLHMSEIYMITFTNEATNQMNDRLQEILLKNII